MIYYSAEATWQRPADSQSSASIIISQHLIIMHWADEAARMGIIMRRRARSLPSNTEMRNNHVARGELEIMSMLSAKFAYALLFSSLEIFGDHVRMSWRRRQQPRPAHSAEKHARSANVICIAGWQSKYQYHKGAVAEGKEIAELSACAHRKRIVLALSGTTSRSRRHAAATSRSHENYKARAKVSICMPRNRAASRR